MSQQAQQLRTFEGTVSEIERFPARDNGLDWLKIRVLGGSESLFLRAGLEQPYPRIGDSISVEASPGKYGFFINHRSMAVTRREQPVFSVEKIGEWRSKAARLAEPILGWLMIHSQVASDDVTDTIRSLAESNDPRIVGLPFQFLARKGIIHRVGYRRSRRREQHHMTVAVWELTLKP